MLKYIHIYIKYLSHTRMPQFVEYISGTKHTWFLSLPLPYWQPRKPWCTNTVSFPLQHFAAAAFMPFATWYFSSWRKVPLISLQWQGTATRPHRCARYGGTKGVWEWSGEDGGRPAARSTLTLLPAMTPGALPPNSGYAALHNTPG